MRLGGVQEAQVAVREHQWGKGKTCISSIVGQMVCTGVSLMVCMMERDLSWGLKRLDDFQHCRSKGMIGNHLQRV